MRSVFAAALVAASVIVGVAAAPVPAYDLDQSSYDDYASYRHREVDRYDVPPSDDVTVRYRHRGPVRYRNDGRYGYSHKRHKSYHVVPVYDDDEEKSRDDWYNYGYGDSGYTDNSYDDEENTYAPYKTDTYDNDDAYVPYESRNDSYDNQQDSYESHSNSYGSDQDSYKQHEPPCDDNKIKKQDDTNKKQVDHKDEKQDDSKNKQTDSSTTTQSIPTYDCTKESDYFNKTGSPTLIKCISIACAINTSDKYHNRAIYQCHALEKAARDNNNGNLPNGW